MRGKKQCKKMHYFSAISPENKKFGASVHLKEDKFFVRVPFNSSEPCCLGLGHHFRSVAWHLLITIFSTTCLVEGFCYSLCKTFPRSVSLKQCCLDVTIGQTGSWPAHARMWGKLTAWVLMCATMFIQTEGFAVDDIVFDSWPTPVGSGENTSCVHCF